MIRNFEIWISPNLKLSRRPPFWLILFGILFLAGACTEYDVDTPDTPANRRGFQSHIGFEPGTDVKRVYYYADELGADVQYQLSFQCSKEVADKIIGTLSLESMPPHQAGLEPRVDLIWWKPDSTTGLPFWSKSKGKQYYWEFWYSEELKQAYYHEYSI